MMNEQFRKEWNCTGTKFTPTHCEWLIRMLRATYPEEKGDN